MIRCTLLLVLAALPVSAAYVADFGSAGQLAADFSSAQGGLAQSATGGINNGPSLSLAGANVVNQKIYMLDQAFSGDLAAWSASYYFRGVPGTAPLFGILSDPSPAITDALPTVGGENASYIQIQTGDGDGGILGIDSLVGSTFTSNYSGVPVPGGLPGTEGFYHYAMAVTYLGLTNYKVDATLTAANADGSLGPVLATHTSTFSNPDLAADDSVYLYFHAYNGGNIDNISFEVVPEPGSSMLAALGLLGGALFRRRPGR